MRRSIVGIALLFTSWPAFGQQPATEPLRFFEALVNRTWVARGEGFSSRLHYTWALDGHLVEVTNVLANAAGEPFLRYKGAYVWDPGRNQIGFWTVSAGGELHQGYARWDGEVLWHEAEIAGGKTAGYASALQIGPDCFAFFMTTGARRAGPALLNETPLVYVPAEQPSPSVPLREGCRPNR